MGLEKINILKRQMGITTEELSEKSGIPTGTLNKILSGQTKDPKLETVKSIARVLGCTIDDFADDSNDSAGLSIEEIAFIKKYRELDTHGRKVIDAILNLEHERCSENKKIAADFNSDEIELVARNNSLRPEDLEKFIDAINKK